MTGKKTDNRDCAIKNPDKWGAEKSENDNNRIERSVKDDDPAQAGFFLSQDSSAGEPACDEPSSRPRSDRIDRPGRAPACERRGKYSQFSWQQTTLSWITKLQRRLQSGHCDDDENARNAGRGHFHLRYVKACVARLQMRIAVQPHLDSRATCTHNAPRALDLSCAIAPPRCPPHPVLGFSPTTRRGDVFPPSRRCATPRPNR